MPKVAAALSAIEVKRLTEPKYHAVGTVPGLHLHISPTGGKTWALITTIGGQRAELGGIGSYPEVTLADAIEQARKLKADIKKGIDPRAARTAPAKVAKQTFRAVAAAYIESHQAGWKNAKHGQQCEPPRESWRLVGLGQASTVEA